MECEDLALGDLVGILEEDLSVDTTRSDKGRVESVDLVCSHNDFDVSSVIETIKLVQKLQHRSLDFSLSSRRRFVSLCTNGVDFIDEDNGWCVLSGDLKIVSLSCGR